MSDIIQGSGLAIKPDMTFPTFIGLMNFYGYKPVDLNALFSAYLTILEGINAIEGQHVPTLILDGPPGVGKTYMFKCFNKLLEGTYIQYNCHPDSSEEQIVRDLNIFMTVLANSGQLGNTKLEKEMMHINGPMYDAVRLSQKGPVVLLIDEIDKARSAVDSLLLGFLNDAYISVQGMTEDFGVGRLHANTRNLITVITKNDERELSAALLRRGRVVYMDYPSPRIEANLLTGMGSSPSIVPVVDHEGQFLRKTTGVGEEAAKMLVRVANKLRVNGGISKPPSSPELERLAADFLRMARNNVRYQTQKDGSKRMVCDIPKAQLNKHFVNAMLAHNFEQPLGVKLMKNSSPGTAFLHAVLNGLGVPKRKLYHLRENDLLALGIS